LLKAKNASVRERAGKLFVNAPAGSRQKAFEDSRACLTLKPAPANGHQVFSRACAQCHRFEREGMAVGPDLFDIRRQPKESILLHIVLPEAEISPNFANYTCETRDGRSLSGLLAGESAGSITLRQAQAIEETIARSNIVRLEASKLSLMPQDLEKTMTLQELADLLAYLRGEKE
jgi:putative heme-binding domain-containing protein